jgi:membrane-bound serine protease (ClpP class)
MRRRLDRRRPVLAAILALAGLVLSVSPTAAVSRGAVVVLPAAGEVDGVMADSIAETLRSAAASGAAAVVIRLDTPGGSLEATQRIVSAMLDSPVPTIVWVAPAGGFAASAGTFITLAANLSFMAPGTRIGAASPVDGAGDDIPGTLGEKVRNDTIAWARSIAAARHRPADWAAAPVAAARSSSAGEAIQLGAVDGPAATIEDVVAAAAGRTVQVAGHDVVLALAGAPIEEVAANPLGGILRLLVDPNIAFLLFTIGALALLFEVQNPNLLTGIFGVVAIALAAVGFVNLPTDLTGLLLVAIGLVLFALEPVGSIYARGEEWSARTADDRPLARGTAVRVVGSDGLTVVVEPDASGLR